MESLVKLLEKNKLTLGSVESITGGLFASSITDVPGASKVFKGSIVSYAVEEKVNIVGVNSKTIEKYGVVSKEVAEEMAKDGKEKLNVDVCVSFTGNAGPTTEPGGEPVGAVYMAIAFENKVISKKFMFNGMRIDIKKQAVLAMREFLENTILENF